MSTLTTFDTDGALLRKPEMKLPITCVPDGMVTFRFENGEASVPSDIDIVENWN